MTANRRIFLNIVATYGRSLYALVVGLFTARWALMALGQVDYGLIGVVGGLTAFVSFLNSLLASAVGRFYGVAIGAAKKQGNEECGLVECREWFNTALLIHTVLPLILILIGYPIGIWAVRHFLNIPIERIDDCVWVWRFTCITCFVGMSSVPFGAMYGAKQEIAELTIYSFFTTTFNAFFLYYMVTHPQVWLAKYSAWTCFLVLGPQLIIAIRAAIKYPECRVIPKYLWNRNRFKQICYYATARFWSDFGGLVQSQGQAILVNKYMGPAANASMAIGNSVASHSLTLFGALQGAMCPAIFNKAGEGDYVTVKKFSFITFRAGSVLILIFAIPLSLEIREVLHLWLVTPPDFVAELCIVYLIRALLESMSQGYGFSILAVGKGVMKYSTTIGMAGFITVLIAWVLLASGLGLWGICIALVAGKVYGVIVRLYFASSLLSYEISLWIKTVFFPVVCVVLVSGSLGYCVHFVMPASFLRVVVSTLVCVPICLLLSWLGILQKEERQYVLKKIDILRSRFGMNWSK